MNYTIKDTTGNIKFVAQIDCAKNKPKAGKLRLAVLWALANGQDLRYADLRYADLRGADLRYADLRYANLQDANLRYADLRYANLQDANLRYANLRYADLRGANLDFSCWPLWCGSLGVKADKAIASQLAYHFCRADFGDDPEIKAAKEALKELANKFHRADECGKIL